MSVWKNTINLICMSVIVSACVTVGNSKSTEGPKNVIIMIGDGMGFSQLDAASIYAYGTPKKQPYWAYQSLAMSTYSESTGEAYDPQQAWASFDYHLHTPTDSAASATALSTGVKTLNGRIGMDAAEKPLRHLIEDAEEMGKATGVLTTVYLSHATPAAFTSHAPSRKDSEAIAQEIINESALDLLIGAGHPWYDDDHQKKAEASYGKVGGETLWKSIETGTAGADADGDGIADPWTMLDNFTGFDTKTGAALPKRLLGVLPVNTTLQFNRGGDEKADAYSVPRTKNLPDMATLMRGALNFLSLDTHGFFLMAEGGAIDWAGHDNLPGRLIEEQRDFDQAIEAVATWVEANSSWDDTLLIITADHETGYLYGKGSNPTWEALQNHGAGKMPDTQWHTHEHTNQLVPLFAKGNGAEELLKHIKGEDPRRGSYVDNTDISKVIRSIWR